MKNQPDNGLQAKHDSWGISLFCPTCGQTMGVMHYEGPPVEQVSCGSCFQTLDTQRVVDTLARVNGEFAAFKERKDAGLGLA